QYIMAMATFVNGDKGEQDKAGPAHYVGRMQVAPDAPIAPGETANVQLKISSPLFDEERLIPLHDPQERIAGLLRFTDSAGHEDFVTLKTDLVPTEFRPQYLP
ncbi:MAG TPA: methane monooxygenase/ammonia monooxygenase subunit B, partial [Candidatus Binataceae bacterium]|nr:methane monooxygenase/ammonia monooxygenase subunit B [Candidatus Binataceae bacterium]